MKTLKRMLCVFAALAVIGIPYELATASAGTTIWQPTSDTSMTWNWQLQGTVPTNTNVQMFDIDGFDNTAATVAALHANGTIAVCYIDFGTAENWRSDYSEFPASVLGNTNGWPGERWLDIRASSGALAIIEPIMTARMEMCKQKDFDALEPDNIDSYENNPGFPTTAADQLTYNEWIANTAHSLGLSVGLKNDNDQTAQLEPYFDWALDEQCNQYQECDTENVFTQANKAVFNAEYQGGTSFCAADIAAHINGVLFSINLDGSKYEPCGGWTSNAPTTTGSTTTSSSTSSTSSSTSSTSSSTSSTTSSTTSTTRPVTTTTTRKRGGGGSTTTTTTSPPRRRSHLTRDASQPNFTANVASEASQATTTTVASLQGRR
ncbi:MAG: endo alpha-1,4 polygalactosaminidase [Acidimicrobiia bacterium]